jgi:hypothetical protein
MAKNARVSLQLARKFVPVAELLKSAHLPQTRTRETVIQRSYTLCEVGQTRWKPFPIGKAPRSDPEKASGFGTTPGLIAGAFQFRVPVTPGISAKSGTNYPSCEASRTAPALGWHGKSTSRAANYVISKAGSPFQAGLMAKHTAPGLECVKGGAA